MLLFSVDVLMLVDWWCLYLDVCTINTANYVGKACFLVEFDLLSVIVCLTM